MSTRNTERQQGKGDAQPRPSQPLARARQGPHVRDIGFDDLVILISIAVGFVGGTCVEVFRGEKPAPAVGAILFATGIASLVYRFLGGISQRTNWYGTAGFRITGSLFALILSFWLIELRLAADRINSQPRTVMGTVVDGKTNLPIANAKVSIACDADLSVMSAADGSYSFSPSQFAQNVRLGAIAPGYVNSGKANTVRLARQLPAMSLTKAILSIRSIQLLDESSAKPSDGGRVLTKLVGRGNSQYGIRSSSDLSIALIFVVAGAAPLEDGGLDLGGTVSVYYGRRELASGPLHSVARLDDWKFRPMAKALSAEAISRYVDLQEGEVPYVVLLDDFKKHEVAHGQLSVEITIANGRGDKAASRLPITVVHSTRTGA